MATIGPSVVKVSELPGFVAGKGPTITRIYRGELGAISDYAASLDTDQSWQIDDSNAPVIQLTVTTPEGDDTQQSTETSVDTWELLGNDLEHDGYEHPRSKLVSDENIKIIRKFLRDLPENTSIALAPQANDFNAASGLFSLMIHGQTSYVKSQYVLRRTQTISSRSQIRASFANIERVYLTSELITEQQPPNGILFSIEEIPVQVANGPDVVVNDFVWGWLKKTPTVTQTSNNRFQITQEFWLELWSSYYYEPLSVHTAYNHPEEYEL